MKANTWKYLDPNVMPRDEIKKIVRSCSVKQLTSFLQTMYDQELLFNKTTAKHDFLEMVLLLVCQRMKKSGSDGGAPSAALQTPAVIDERVDNDLEDELEDEEDEDEEEGPVAGSVY